MKRSREVGGVWMEDSWPRKDLLAYLLWEDPGVLTEWFNGRQEICD